MLDEHMNKIANAIVVIVLFMIVTALLSEPLYPAQVQKVRRIGWLSIEHGPTIDPIVMRALYELGWVEGENIIIEARFAKEKLEKLPKLARELVESSVDLIVAADTPVIAAAQQASNTIPIIMGLASDPVSLGYVSSLARPDGNITGLSHGMRPSSGKRLQVFKEALPSLFRVAVLAPPRSRDWSKFNKIGQALELETKTFEFDNPGELEQAFRAVLGMRANGLMVAPSALTNLYRRQIIAFASDNRLPAMYPRARYVTDGGLISYGANHPLIRRRIAYYVDRILKGAKPSDLPVERNMTTELVINVKTANEIGIKIDPEVLQRADRVIK